MPDTATVAELDQLEAAYNEKLAAWRDSDKSDTALHAEVQQLGDRVRAARQEVRRQGEADGTRTFIKIEES
jgi:hypothetical protein